MSYLAPAELEQMLEPTKFDKTIAVWFPKWGAQRVRQRRQYAYEAAVNTRLRATTARLQGPEDFQAFPDRLALMRQVRDLEQNFGLFQGIIDKLCMYSFGRVQYQARTGDKDRDDEYEQYLTEECFKKCDISNRFNFRGMIALAYMARLRDGDFGLKWQRNGMGDLKLNGIEGDRIGGINMTSVAENYFQGINVDPETGIPISYAVYYRTKADAYVNPVQVPAQDMMLVCCPRRYNQYRGVTPFAPIIHEARDLKELMEALRIGTKFENYHSAIQYTASGLPLEDPATFFTSSNGINNQTTSNGQPITEQDIKFGKVQVAPLGSKVEFLKSDRPSGTVQTYMENLIRLMGVALNMPYGFLYNLSGLAGPGVRMDSGQAQRVIQLVQEDMKDQAMEQIKNTYLMEGFARGKIRYTPDWKSGMWQFPPWPTIDGGRDSAAGINEWRAGLGSKSIWFAEQGLDAEEEEETIDEEVGRTMDRAQALAQKYSVPIELALDMLEGRKQNGFYMAKAKVEDKTDAPTGANATPAAGPAQMSQLVIKHEFAKPETAPVGKPDPREAASAPLAREAARPFASLRERVANFQKAESARKNIHDRAGKPDRIQPFLDKLRN